MNTEQIMVLADAYAAQQSHADWQAEEGWKEDVIAAAQQAAAEARAALEAALTEKQEPFGYFRPEPFGWTDCAETDEGAIALYEHPAPVNQQLLEKLKGAAHYIDKLGGVSQPYRQAIAAATTPDSATRSADSAEPFCDCTPNHLCKGRMVHLPRGEQCDQCGEEA